MKLHTARLGCGLPLQPSKHVLSHDARVVGLEASKRTEPPPMAW